MRLTGISLQQFRSYPQRTFLFTQPTTVVVGANAVGKTSLLEAVQLLATGESFRATEVAEMIAFGAELGRVQGKVDETTLDVTLTRGEVQGRRTSSKLYAVNQVRRLKKNFVGNLLAVSFRPEDLRLIEGSPSRRRGFLDTVLAMTSREYAASLKIYEDALKRRNRLLWQIQEGLMQPSVLTYWNSLLLKHGEILQEVRRQLVGFLNTVPFPLALQVEYLPSVMSEARQREYAAREMAAGHTLIGPHKDDLRVILNSIQDPSMDSGSGPGTTKNIAQYGSRGQQRLAVLWLKMGELAYVRQATGSQPVLLLDDILSELDAEHREHVFALLSQGQTILTTTEESLAAAVKEVMPTVDVLHL